jgi:hypothetical protein
MTDLYAVLHSVNRGRAWHVEFNGEMVVVGSRDPEPDLARVLLARGYTGTVIVLDSVTRTARTFVNIEKAAKVCSKEGPLRFAPYESRPERAPAGEREAA